MATASVSETVPAGVARKVGEQERLFHYLHAYGGLIPVQVLHIRGRIDPEQVKGGLAYLQRIHPILRAHIRYEGIIFVNKPPFVYRQPWLDTRGTTEVPFRVINDPDPERWRHELDKELKKAMPRGKNPRMRVLLVREHPDAELNHLFFTADHICADAQAHNMGSRHFLEYLADPGMAEQRVPVHTGLPPALEHGMRRSNNGTGQYHLPIRLPHKRVPGGKQATRQIVRRLDADAANAIRAAFKSHRTTLHGAITAGFFMAIREKYGFKELTTLATVDMRRLCKPPFPTETYGCFIDLLRTKHAVDGDYWTIAQDVSFKLIQTIAKDQEAASIMKLWGWPFYRDEAWDMIRHGRRMDAVAVTTAGESSLGREYGRYTLEDVTMAVSTVMFGVSLFVISAERLDGLTLYVCYADYATAKAEVEELTDRAIEVILREAQAAPAALAAQ